MDALLNVTEKFRKYLNLNLNSVLLDVFKAFDNVDYELLIEKLDNYGIRGRAIKLLQSYLEDRKQYVKYNLKKSSLAGITIVVPHGSSPISGVHK